MTYKMRWTAVGAGLIGLVGIVPVHAENLIYGSYLPPEHLILEHGIQPIAKEIGEDLEFEIVPGGQLFSAATAFRGIGSGVADAGGIVNAYSRSPLKHAVIPTDLSFIARNPIAADGAAHETYFLNCPECLEDFKKSNTVFLAGSTAGGYSLMCNTPVENLADVSGKKIRTAGAMGRLAQAMGGTPVSMSTSDMVEGISRGQIDCIMGPMAWLNSYPIEDIVESVYNFGIGAFNSIGVLLLNRDVWDGLSDAQQQALWAASPGIVARTTIKGYMGEYLEALNAAEQNGITVLVGGDEIDEFAVTHAESEAVAVAEEARKIGVDNPEPIIDAFIKNLRKWQKLTEEAGIADVVPSPELTQAELDRALPIYEQLLRENVYDKVDPSKL
ncbi:C4-dicarboxylate TRAP transporter substrate-binding protein [Hoeflea sp. WL0058]|uniref:C4-dicarboxylate TRAP transporter substrate-binding protein n=1 Tax=Flavimaribacter sediminis TaxID=2865987 RepID=A0AAE2ZKI9_9HYPH|nr:C4-dicarboxylate TRAP transporter substrate-binding protein [Flavimaribacter sediminis]MBW8637871.1 C4-dicarboxylate TRAP transporter substrate-binding protein [Flavimaribacter sediminis]